MPLSLAPKDVAVTVSRVSADETVRHHLENLGILPESQLTVLSENDGDVILKVKDGRLALNKQLAMKIFVRF